MDAPLQIPLPFAYEGAERRLTPRAGQQVADRRLPDPSTEQDHPELCEPEVEAQQ